MTNRRRFTADFKAKVALEALRGDKTIQEIRGQVQGTSEPGERVETPGEGRSGREIFEWCRTCEPQYSQSQQEVRRFE